MKPPKRVAKCHLDGGTDVLGRRGLPWTIDSGGTPGRSPPGRLAGGGRSHGTAAVAGGAARLECAGARRTPTALPLSRWPGNCVSRSPNFRPTSALPTHPRRPLPPDQRFLPDLVRTGITSHCFRRPLRARHPVPRRAFSRICARKSALRICPTRWSYDSPMIPLPHPPNRPIVRSFWPRPRGPLN